MTRFIIQSVDGTYDEPNAIFDTLEEAEAGLQSLVDVCGYDGEEFRIIEEEPRPTREDELAVWTLCGLR